MQKLNIFIKRNVLGEGSKPETKKTDMEKYVKMFENSPTFENGENPFINNLTYLVPTIDLPSTANFNKKCVTDRSDKYQVIPLKSDETKIKRRGSALYNPISFINSQLSHNKRQRKKIINVINGTRDFAYSELMDRYTKEKNSKKIRIYQRKSDSESKGIISTQLYDEIREENNTKDRVFKFYWDKDTEIKWKPEIREGGTMITINGMIYLYGGISRSFIGNNSETMQWWKVKTQGDIPPWGRTGHTMVKWKKGFVIFGGEKSFNQILRIRDCFSDAKYFSIEKNEWQTLRVSGDILEARRNHAACMVDSLKWELLEIVTEDKKPFANCFHTMTAIFRADPKVYTLYNPFDFVKEKKINKVKHEGLYIFGGKGNNGINSNLAIVKIGSRPLRLEYPETKGIPPSGRYQHCMHFFKAYNILVIYGGRIDGDFEDPLDALQPNIHVLSLENMNWCSVSTFGLTQTHKCAFSSTIYDTKLVIFGGVNFQKYIEQEVFFLELDQSKTRMMALRNDYNPSKTEEDHKESSIFSDIDNSGHRLPPLDIRKESIIPHKSIQSFVPIPTKFELRRTSTRLSSLASALSKKDNPRSSIKNLDINFVAQAFLSSRKPTK